MKKHLRKNHEGALKLSVASLSLTSAGSASILVLAYPTQSF
ncbi:hypothetical protein [Dyadobacter sp. CY345]|nr:hypothetical protein [Dyadobacter sp. CY345]